MERGASAHTMQHALCKHRQNEALISAMRSELNHAVKESLATKPLARENRCFSVASNGCAVITRNACVGFENDGRNSINDFVGSAALPLNKSGAMLTTNCSQSTNLAYDVFERLVVEANDSVRKKMMTDTIQGLTRKHTIPTLGEMDSFAKKDSKISEVFHVKPLHADELRSVCFTADLYFHTTIFSSDGSNVPEYILLIAFQKKEQIVFMRMMNIRQTAPGYLIRDFLLIFNGDVRFSIDIIPPATDQANENHEDHRVVTQTLAKILENLEPVENTPSSVIANRTRFEPEKHDATLFYLRQAYPRMRYVRLQTRPDGDVALDGQLNHLKRLIQPVYQAYYTRDSLLAVAVAFERELKEDSLGAFELEGGPKAYVTNNALAKASILSAIEKKTEASSGIDKLQKVISILSRYVGTLFDKIIQLRTNDSDSKTRHKDNAKEVIGSMHTSQPPYNFRTDLPPDDLTIFGYLLTVHLMETVGVSIVSKFSSPPRQPRKTRPNPNGGIIPDPDAVTADPRAVVCRLKGVRTTVKKHTTGLTWANAVTAVTHGNHYLHLHDIIASRSVYDSLNLFKEYSIFSEFPGVYEKRGYDPNDFEHSICVRCDASTVMEITMESPCKKLQGVVKDNRTNTL